MTESVPLVAAAEKLMLTELVVLLKEAPVPEKAHVYEVAPPRRDGINHRVLPLTNRR
ncbi:MAG: hypothetical protein R2822_05105 [Spirosomataceae bacterium]